MRLALINSLVMCIALKLITHCLLGQSTAVPQLLGSSPYKKRYGCVSFQEGPFPV